MTKKTGWLCVLLVFAFAAPLSAEDAKTQIDQQRRLLSEASGDLPLGSGAQVSDDLRFNDISGNPHYLVDDLSNGPAVFVFLSTKCPVAKRYSTRLNELHSKFAANGVALYAVYPNSDETDEGLAEFVKAAGFKFPVVSDPTGYLVRELGATMTPQAFIVDQYSVIRFRGAIDDNRYETRVRNNYLGDALSAVLNGQSVQQPAVDAVGCTIHLDQPAAKELTYSSHIARILQDNCQACHRPDQVAPFALTNFEEANRWKTEIKEYTQSRLMPPWLASPRFGHFQDDPSLSTEEIAMIANWVDQGAPRGKEKLTPPSPRFNDGWAFGEPDLVIEMPEEYVVGPEGEDDYRHFVVPYEYTKDRFIEAIDVRPGNRAVVHHVLAYADKSGKARELDAADPGPGYTRFGDVGFDIVSALGGWAPGNDAYKTPVGSGRWLPKECDIVMQVHYYRTGVEERDKTKIGLYFSKDPNPVPVRGDMAINHDFVVPAGEKNYEVRAECKIDEPSYLFSVTPHMHLIGTTMEVIAERPDGVVLPVVKIDNWDFNWQITYRLQEFEYLPAGSVVKLVATFDNSADNPNNPNHPPKDVGWGEKTTDEMCIAFIGLLKESEYDPERPGRREDEGKVVTQKK